jgi:serine/threonine protein kinase
LGINPISEQVLSSAASFSRTYVGTPYYMSPELVNKRGYNEKSDIWALGCILHEMAALVPPFQAEDEAELAVKINRGRVRRLPCVTSHHLGAFVGGWAAFCCVLLLLFRAGLAAVALLAAFLFDCQAQLNKSR